MKAAYKPGSAGSLMVKDMIVVKQSIRIKDVKAIISDDGKKLGFIDYIYATDRSGNFSGVMSVKEVLNSPNSAAFSRLMKKKPAFVSPYAEGEMAAHYALKKGIKAVPVVKMKKIIGVIPPKTVMSILNKSIQEDILHFAGIHKSHLKYEDTMKVPLLVSVKHRTPWLVIGLIGIMIAAGVIGAFEAALEKYIILAFFIPAIVYLSGALCTQLVTLFVRDLSIQGKKLKLHSYFLRQTFIATFLGVIMSFLTFLIIFAFWKESYVGFVIAVALFVALIVTNFASLATTFVIYKLGKDPALGSGPFATVLSDFTSIVIYLAVASLLLM